MRQCRIDFNARINLLALMGGVVSNDELIKPFFNVAQALYHCLSRVLR